MDASAPGFRGLTAHLARVFYTKIIQETNQEHATLALARGKGSEMRFRADFTKPDHRLVAYGGRKLEIFNPKINTVQEIDLGKHKGLVEQFLLLGFGSSGRDLRKSYDVKYLREDTVEGQKCSCLELVPKSAQVRDQFQKIELCIADPGGYPVRQKLIEPSGNYTLYEYSEVKINPELKPAQLTLQLPANVKREYPQK